jgi:hypothetical protein
MVNERRGRGPPASMPAANESGFGLRITGCMRGAARQGSGCLARSVAALPRSHGNLHPHFFGAGNPYGFPYTRQKNVAYTRNVIRHSAPTGGKIIRVIDNNG